MVSLRPHHVLCINGFVGKGYNKEFIDNMQKIVDRIIKDGEKINIIFSTDDICSKCPYMKSENLCCSQQKVELYDKRTANTLNLREKEYTFNQIKKLIKKLDSAKLKFICGDCSWFESGICRERMKIK